MRYWIKLGSALRGPLDAEEVAVLPGMGPHTLLCPEGKDPHKRTHWDFARSFPDVRVLLEKPRERVLLEEELRPDPPVPEAAAADPALPAFDWSALAPSRNAVWGAAACALTVILWKASWRTPPPAPTRRAKPAAATGIEGALQTRLLSCGRTIQEAGGPWLRTRWLGKTRYEIIWGSGTQEVRMEYDVESRQFKPLTAAARLLTRPGGSCPGR